MPLSDRPQSNKQHPVPQNIMDVEFKLIGDLTMRQFVYLFVCGISAYLSYVLVYGLFKWPVVISLALLGLGLAFVPISERGLDEWIVNFFRAINMQTQKIWRKEPQVPTAFLYDSLAVVKQEMITLAPASSRRKLEEYLKYKADDNKEDPLDIPERDYAMKVHMAYPEQQTYSSGVGVKLEDYIPAPKLPEESLQGDIEEEFEEKKKSEEYEEGEEKKKEEDKKDMVVEKVKAPVIVFEEEKKEVKRPEELQNVKVEKEKHEVEIEEKVSSQPLKIIKGRAADIQDFRLPGRFDKEDSGFSFNPITPDMHSGRKFVNLVPSQGTISLPIRGERVLKTTSDLIEQESLDDKTKKLNDLLQKIREEEGLTRTTTRKVTPVVEEKPVLEIEDKNQKEKGNADVGFEAKNVAESLQKQNEDLSSEITRLKDQIQRGKSMSLNTSTQEQLLSRLESQKEKIVLSYSDLQRQYQELQRKLEDKEASQVTSYTSQVKRIIPALTGEKNVITGIVRDENDRLLPGTLLIIKNMRGEAVRAIKTNSLGQFIASTPLQNGAYTVEVSSSNKLNLTFGIIPIEVKGEVMSPLDIVGK